MGDFIQLRGRRTFDNRLYDTFRELYASYEKGLEKKDAKLKEKVQPWIQDHLDDHQPEGDAIDPKVIIDAFEDRVCEIAGHVWIEFALNINDAGTGSEISMGDSPHDTSINAYIAEFLPAPIDIKAVEDAFKSKGKKIIWNNITDLELFTILLPLFIPSLTNRSTPADGRSFVCGAVPGEVFLRRPEEVRELSEDWFNDRVDAYTTPKWLVNEPLRELEAIKKNAGPLRYSYTPEHYTDADNCVTWMSRAMDLLAPPAPDDWLAIINGQCAVTVAHPNCPGYHIKAWGTMKCTIPYIEAADTERQQNGLKTF